MAAQPYHRHVTAPDLVLRQAWHRVAGPHDELAERFLGHYREPGRHYHSAAHVVHVLRHLDAITGSLAPADAATIDLDGVRWAALYHDVIYDARASDNEARSADMAVRHGREVGFADERLAAVHRLVMATASHRPSRLDEAVLCDADLAVLGADPNDYLAYARGVRAEYAHLDEATWLAGRAAVLQRLLDSDPLFHTEFMRTARGARARANLSAELASLR